MTIEKGKEWGTSIVVPKGVISISRDSDLASQSRNTLCQLTAGELWRTLGEPVSRQTGEEATVVPIDALEVSVVEAHHTTVMMAVSNVQIGRLFSLTQLVHQQRFVVVTNCGLVDDFNVAPRAHPNDGLFDVVAFSPRMSLMQRVLSRQRLRTGTHVPHPDISVTRLSEFEVFRTGARESLLIDSVPVRDWYSLSIRILPDYWRVII